MAPVALGVKITQRQRFGLTEFDSGHPIGDLASDKLKAAPRALVIEENSADAEHAVSFAVIARQIEASHFANSIR